MVAPNATETLNVSAPISVNLGSDCCPVQQLAASLSHPLVGGFSGVLGKCAAAIRNDKDVISLLYQAKSRESNTDFCQDAARESQRDFCLLKRRKRYLMTICFLPLALTALAKSSLSMALI